MNYIKNNWLQIKKIGFFLSFQDICLVLAFTVLLFSLYSTYVFQVSFFRQFKYCNGNGARFKKKMDFNFQAGLAELLYSKFRAALIVLAVYFLMTLAHHIWIIIDHHKTPNKHEWSTSLTTLFIIQRICKWNEKLLFQVKTCLTSEFESITVSPLYYYTYKRAALRMSDPRFYENLDWVSEFLAIR